MYASDLIETVTNIMSRCNPNHWLSEGTIISLIENYNLPEFDYSEVLEELVEMGCAEVLVEDATTYWRLT